MFIKSSVLRIEHVYSSDQQLVLPRFQRAYAWNETHVGRLIHDLIEALESPRRRYSLGHMSLARREGEPAAGIIDGHQRSISLTMLFAILRDLIADGPMAERLHEVVRAPGGAWRLMPQRGVAAFFREHVQERGSSLVEPRGDIMMRSPHERNIIANRDHMRKVLTDEETRPRDLVELARFLLEDCVIILDELEDEEEARDLMQREEDTGLSPHSSELAKVTILTAMPSHEQEQASELFEAAQSLLSADDMSHLLGHIRLLKTRRRSTRAVDGELINRFELAETGLPFLKDELLPRAAALDRLNRRNVGTSTTKAAISRSLDMLYRVDHKLWVPAALHWLAVKGAEDPETAAFFERLDRLTYLLKIASVDPTDQEKRFLRLLDSIDSGAAVERIGPLDIERRLLAGALDNLRSRTFYAKRFHGLVLCRISEHLDPKRTPAGIDGETVTVEHVLPRNPKAGQQWRTDFPTDEDVADHCNRLGNLAFLTQEANNRVANADHMVKRFVLVEAGSKFVLSEHAGKETRWTGDTILRRTEELIAILLEPWQLSA